MSKFTSALMNPALLHHAYIAQEAGKRFDDEFGDGWNACLQYFMRPRLHLTVWSEDLARPLIEQDVNYLVRDVLAEQEWKRLQRAGRLPGP